MNYKSILISGLLALGGAVSVDLHAWQQSGAAFDYRLAAKRYVASFIAGCLAGMGINAAS